MDNSKVGWSIAAPIALAIVITYLGVTGSSLLEITGTTLAYFVWGTLFALVVADFFFRKFPFRKDNFIGYFVFIFLVVFLAVVGNSAFNLLTYWVYALAFRSIPLSCLIPLATNVGPYSDSMGAVSGAYSSAIGTV